MQALSNRTGEKVFAEKNMKINLYVEEICRIHVIEVCFFEHVTAISTLNVQTDFIFKEDEKVKCK